MGMFELRKLIPKGGNVAYQHRLQYRTLATYQRANDALCVHYPYRWSEWKDVPTVVEGEDDE